jgi:hypothetical protein
MKPSPQRSLPRGPEPRGSRVPRRRALAESFTVHVDTREKYPYRFADRDCTVERVAVVACDCGVRIGDLRARSAWPPRGARARER